MIYLFKDKQSGFTLIEIIITIIVFAILGTISFTYLGTSFTQSSMPIHRLKKTFELQQVMESITSDYKFDYTSNLIGLPAKIGNEGTNQSNDYGQYTVVNNRFIKFVNYAEAPIDTGDPQNILKVSIKNDLGEILTVLFSSR